MIKKVLDVPLKEWFIGCVPAGLDVLALVFNNKLVQLCALLIKESDLEGVFMVVLT